MLEHVVYGRAGREELLLDLALPDRPGPLPLILVIHGGGFSGGSRTHVRPDLHHLAGAGYAAAALDYRLVGGGQNTFPAAVADVRCATRFLRTNAARWNIDPERIAAIGFSAGGHLAAMLATADERSELDDACDDLQTSAGIIAAVSYYGPADFRPETSQSWGPHARRVIGQFLGASAEADPARAALASPIAHVDSGDSPLLLIHGSLDPVVPVSQSESFGHALARAGVPHLTLPVPEGRHGFRLFSRQPMHREATCTTLAFFEDVFQRDTGPETSRSLAQE